MINAIKFKITPHCVAMAVALCVPVSHAADQFGQAVIYPTGSWAEVAAVGDVNGDGTNEVLVATSSYFDVENDRKLFVFDYDAVNGLLQTDKLSLSGSARSIALGDMNNDGRTDVLVATGNALELFIQDQAGALADAQILSTSYADKVVIADLDNDGLAEIAAMSTSGTDLAIFDAAFNLMAVYYAPHGAFSDLTVGDISGDGLADVIVMSGSGTYDNLSVLRQDGAGGFLPTTYHDLGGSESGGAVAIGDLNSDGANDIVMCYGGNRPNSFIAEFLQDDLGGLVTPSISVASYDIPEAVTVADVDGDGREDVLVLHAGAIRMGVYIQDGAGALMPETLYPIPYASHYNPHGFAVGDVDGNGSPDAVIADYNSGLVVLYNTESFNHPEAPVAEAGTDFSIKRRTTAFLDGRASIDTDGQIVSYEWQQTGGIPVQLWFTGELGVVGFNTSNMPKGGTLTFELTVTDDSGMSDTDSITVDVFK